MARALVSSVPSPSPRASLEEKLKHLYRRRVLVSDLINYLEQYAGEGYRRPASPTVFSSREYMEVERLAS